MAGEDPFGLNDSERTQFLRPQPGGRLAGEPAPRQRTEAASGEPLPEGTPGRGPLVQAAYGILALAPRLASRTPPAEPAALRARLEGELERFNDRAHAKSTDGRQVQLGHYVLCALLDDVLLNTPWGSSGSWRGNSLAGTLHHDVAAGERFFDILEQARRDPQRSRPLLELMAACLSLGFEGRYRLAPAGGVQLAGIREGLLAQLAGLDGPLDRDLSPMWRGAEARHVPLSERIPLWVAGVAAVLLLAVVYTLFSFRLAGFTERLGPLVASLPPVTQVSLLRPQPVAAARPAAPAPPRAPIVTPLATRLRSCLSAAGVPAQAVSEDFQKLRIRLPNAGLFGSGKADLDPRVTPLIQCLGRELGGESGRLMVIGHSDNQPIRTARFPSNWELSRARADAVRIVLVQGFADPARVGVDGRADTEPLVPNTDEAGRASNRRVDIVLLR